MFPVKRTVFFEFQFLLGGPPVFAGGIVPPFALAALKRYQFHNLFLTLSHVISYLALNQNRTDDLILTMDMLCQLSYKDELLRFYQVMLR